MANAGNIALVIGAIRGELETNTHDGIGFNMASYVAGTSYDLHDMSNRGCGTIACIAGHAYLLATSNDAEFAMEEDPDEIERIAAGFIGIGEDDARHLFYDLPQPIELKDVTPDVAIDTLQRLAQSGTVQWNL